MTASGFVRGFHIQNSTNVTLTDCTSTLNSQFGFNVDDSDTVLFDGCVGTYNGLDGIKLRKMAANVTVTGCTLNYNGTDPANAGDGIDIYAGGTDTLIEYSDLSFNDGNGVTAKTDTSTRDEPLVYGVPGNITVRNCTCNDNDGSGLTAYAFGDVTIPLFVGATFLDCECKRNVNYGIYINADEVSATNITVDDSGIHGVLIDVRSGATITLTNVTGDDIVDDRP